MSGFIRKMLIAEAGYQNRSILKAVFKDYFDIIEAENGIETINLLRENPDTAIVLLGLAMPEMDGFSVLMKLENDGVLHTLPVVALTYDTEVDSQIRALDLGAMDVILMPFNSKVILHRVNNILAHRENEQFVEESRRYVEEIRQKEEQYRKSMLDEKTGLYTRQCFCNEVRRTLDENPDRLYVLVRWDIDRFRVFNDVYGVKGGDSLLFDIGEMYRTNRDMGLVYGYLGVDHFISLVEMIDFDIDAYMAKVEERLHRLNGEFEFVTRYGIYVIEDPETDVSLMCDRALFALRSSKEGKGPDRYVFYDNGMRALAIEEQEIVNEINSAIEEGQIEVYYQPQINFSEGKLIGAEALVRWNHPEKGLFSPGRFIPVLEKNGLVSKLDFFVWEQVAKQLRTWIDEGLKPIPVSVNLSRIDVYSKGLVTYMNTLMERYRLDRGLLRLAVTEGTYDDNPQQLESIVNELHASGYLVEMDDFGGGSGTLNALKDLPVDTIKLDMHFLRECTKNSRGKAILEMIVKLSENFRTPIVAEGVEQLSQAEFLQQIGCERMQGFLFSKPLPAADFESYLKHFDSAEEGSIYFSPEPEKLETREDREPEELTEPLEMEENMVTAGPEEELLTEDTPDAFIQNKPEETEEPPELVMEPAEEGI